MKRGRKQTPTALKLLKGNPGKRPINGDEPMPAPLETLDPPVWLDPVAAEIWADLAPRVHALGLLTHVDSVRFGMLCTHIARWRRHCVADPDAADHTRAGLLRREAEIVARLAACFGLDPASRAGLRVAKRPAADALDDFLSTAE